MPPSPAEALLASASRSPDAYPQRLDLERRAVLLLGFDARSYRTASFLDDRVLAPSIAGTWVGIEHLDRETQAIASPRPLHLILHTGHVGSTLLSRLLDDLGGTLPLREPLPLRTLAEAHDSLDSADPMVSRDELARLGMLFLRLWGRGYGDTRQCVLKATSTACRVAPWLIAQQPGMRAAYLNIAAEPYLATLLAGENSQADLRGHGPERQHRLLAAGVAGLPPLHALTAGELAAQGWLAESLTRHRVATLFPGRVLLVDFDALLRDVPGAMQAVARHLGIDCTPALLQALAASPTLQRYSKAPEHSYGPQLRADILKQSRRDNAAQIAAGLRLVETVARSHAELAAAVQASGIE
jgi:hypothetical protein